MAKETGLLIQAYYSYRDPVFQSAVLPYFLNFPQKQNFRFVLLTYEHDQYPLNSSMIHETARMLAEHHITWKRLTWRSGRFKILKKCIDFLTAVTYSAFLVKSQRLQAIYSEGLPGAILGFYASHLSGCKHIIHTFEPHADYMIEAGVWQKNSWEARVVNWHEMRLARQATYLFTATQGMIDKLSAAGISKEKIFRVPSCVDMNHFQFDLTARIGIRRKMGVGERSTVLVYLGKFGGMYMEEEAFEFFRLFQEQEDCWILIISQENKEKISDLTRRHGLLTDKVISISLEREKIPGWLSAADLGFVAVRQRPSKRFCSPIKTGEYLACGLPVIVPEGISDDWKLLEELNLAVVLKAPEKNDYLEVMKAWQTRIKTIDPVETRTKARAYVDGNRSISHYRHLYRELFEKL